MIKRKPIDVNPLDTIVYLKLASGVYNFVSFVDNTFKTTDPSWILQIQLARWITRHEEFEDEI
jgi:hypothetical protein